MMTRAEEDHIRQIVREEIALDEQRRLAEAADDLLRPTPKPAVPGAMPPPPGTVFLARQDQ